MRGIAGAGTDGPGVLDSGCRLVRAALPKSGEFSVVRALSGGYTDAQVVLCDISPGQSARSSAYQGPNGQYILKAARADGGAQATAHTKFCEALSEFAARHVPKLVLSLAGAGITADVYDIAGLYTFDKLRSAEHATDYRDREQACAEVARDLLAAQLAAAEQPDYGSTGGGVLEEWLGKGFPGNRRGARAREVANEFTRGARVFQYDGDLLPDPLALFGEPGGLCAAGLPCLRGTVHGDLHLRNIMVRGSLSARDLEYWLIDVGWDAPAPLLYDHAYLEVAALLDGIRRSATSVRVLSLLASLDEEQLVTSAELRSEDAVLAGLVGQIRAATVGTLQAKQPRREDVWRRQFLYARVAVGLNWAGKAGLERESRRTAYLSACWAARLLLREHHQDLWMRLAREGSSAAESRAATPVASADALRAWEPFQAGSGGNTDLFLIGDQVEAADRLAALGGCRWAAVIDLDPDSDAGGMLSMVEPALRELRHVSVFGKNVERTAPDVATNWLMANGWRSHGESAAASPDDWRRGGYLSQVRRLVDWIREQTPNTRAAVLCLRSGRHDPEIERVLEYIDERYGGIAERLDLAQSPAVSGTDLTGFLDVVGAYRPAMSVLVPALPAIEGQWRVKWADLHRLYVDLEVLHSEVLSQPHDGLRPSDEFWRGRPPTWGELEAGLDIPRDIFPELYKDLHDRLDNHQLAIIHLTHSPGAGGTTLARRLAWSLHRRFPTVLLREFSPGTIERVDEIYQETGLPALVIAESADLPESERDELRNGLLQRNSRAVILWVNRTTTTRVPQRHVAAQRYFLLDPLSDRERASFLAEYRQRAETEQSGELLASLAAGSAAVLPPQWLSPFYFGLCVYDAEFTWVSEYVRNHLRDLGLAQQAVARLLALVTGYGQQHGLPVDFVQHLLGADRLAFEALTDEQLRDTLGPDLRHLVVQGGSGLRLLHPRIAHKVLSAEMGGTQLSLGQVAVDFIKKVTEYFGPNNSTTDRLLASLFTRRNVLGGGSQDNFSDLILAMSREEAEWVFEVLTTACPDNAHFWNHRGRYHIYRVRGDFGRAEEYLLTAVQKSHGTDGLHQHTLGMVRRFWIEDQLTEIMRRTERPTPEAALAEILPLFDKAMEAFWDAAQARNEQNEHAWTTPIQLIAHVIERLIQLSGLRNLPEFIEGHEASSKWVAGQIAYAEELLDNLHGGFEHSSYPERLTNQLMSLYGNLDELVSRWKAMKASGNEAPEVSQALARTIFAQSGRDWTLVTDTRMREIAEMAEEAVHDGKASNSDLRLWLQAYRRLPEYSETSAIERLRWYLDNRQSLDAAYYLYVVHFIMWDRGDARDTNQVSYYMEECRRLSRGQRRQWSFEWLGIEERSHPLVHFSELGTQRGTPTGFWSRPHQLRRVTGIIEEIKSPQSGTVKILNSQLTAFFAPRNQFRQTRDVNAAIDFYLGFSYEGLRAWEPTYQGQIPDALRLADPEQAASRTVTRRPGKVLVRTVPELLAQPPVAEGPERPMPEDKDQTALATSWPVPRPPRRRREKSLLEPPPRQADGVEDYQATILALLLDAQQVDGVLRSLELGEALKAVFGQESYERFRDGGLKKAVARLGFRIEETKQGFNVEMP
jgi:hypothetical protein